MTENEATRTMREFIRRQGDKLRTIEGSIAWRNGYGAALDSMSRVLDALEEPGAITAGNYAKNAEKSGT